MQGKGLAAPDWIPSPSINMANLTRLSVLIGEADADRSREIAALLAELGVRQVLQVDALASLLLALKTRAFDVVLCAEQLGGDDGVAVLREARKVAPATRAVLMRHSERAGAFVPPDIEAIELPFSRLILQGLLHRTASPQGGLWCEVPELSLSDILQMYHQANRSITVLLSGPIAGRIWLEAGEIVDAEAGDERGMTALSRLLEAETGLLRTEPPRSDTRRTISASFQSVILEAAHKLDERRRDSQGSPMSAPSSSSPPRTAPASGSSVPAISAPVGSFGSAAPRQGPGSHHLGQHDFLTRELPRLSSELQRPAMTPMLQTLAPSPEAFLLPSRAARRRQTLIAVISVLSSLLFLAVAALYFKSRLDTSAVEPARRDENEMPAEPNAAVVERPSAPAREPTEDEATTAPAPSGELPAGEARGVRVQPPRASSDPEGPGEVSGAPEAAPEKAAAAGGSSFELRITSKPSHAWVVEEGRVLGKTPLTVTIPVSSVADAPREFLVRLPGFFPVRISRGASDSNVSSAVVLYPRPTVVEAPDGGQLEYDPEPTRPGNPRPRQKDLGIRLRR
jgi:CheY-like chemotaxis protein